MNFYVTAEGQLMAVDVEEADGRLQVGLPRHLFDAGVSAPQSDEYEVTQDGRRFLVITPAQGGEERRRLQVILNWPALLD